LKFAGRLQIEELVLLERSAGVLQPSSQSAKLVLYEALLAGGDDYEFCFTAPVPRRARVQDLSKRLGSPAAPAAHRSNAPERPSALVLDKDHMNLDRGCGRPPHDTAHLPGRRFDRGLVRRLIVP
jgi:thiamine monophosphate kinase